MSKEAAKILAQRKQRVLDAVALKQPDRVPMYFSLGMFPATYTKISFKDAIEDLGKWHSANEVTYQEYQPDFGANFLTVDVEANSLLCSRIYKWPGHGIGINDPFQFVEYEHISADEYDTFINDPGDFLIRKYWPRLYGGLEGLTSLPPLKKLGLSPLSSIGTLDDPALSKAFNVLSKVIRKNAKFRKAAKKLSDKLENMGFPVLISGTAQAPFDAISDFLRGMRGTTLDMYRCPEKLIAAQKAILPITINSAVSTAATKKKPLVFIPLHRGSDGFMSLEQFETFYWPFLKQLIEAVINAGLIPFIFWEGTWDERLEYLAELPKGKILGFFDRTNLFRAKEIIGNTMCICGGMPASLLQTGTANQVRELTKKLIAEVGKGGGYIMGPNTVMDYANPELVRVWVDATREYGYYS